jgi:hypothetical protein
MRYSKKLNEKQVRRLLELKATIARALKATRRLALGINTFGIHN